MSQLAQPAKAPALTPFGLRLHHDGRFTHEGSPILNRRLREHFEQSVEFLQGEQKFIVRLKHFRGEIEVQEAGFFVRSIELSTGEIHLSDGSREILDVSTLSASSIDGAFLCRIKRDRVSEGLLARFSHAAQAEFVQGLEEDESGYVITIAGRRELLPEL